MNSIGEIRGLPPQGPAQKNDAPEKSGQGPSFLDVLKDKTEVSGQIPSDNKLKFSNHATERMTSRGINLNKTDFDRMGKAVENAEKKGSKEMLVLMGENAFIVNVKNKMVVTAMDRNLMKENLFTNIDSTIML